MGGNARIAAGAEAKGGGRAAPISPPWVRLEALCVPLTIPPGISR